jgi:hypothetical protein
MLETCCFDRREELIAEMADLAATTMPHGDEIEPLNEAA